MPAVSVIVPARDAAATLPATLAGLAAQSLDAPVELVVVDDGSHDATARLARAAGATVVPGAGAGPAEARNRGAAAAGASVLAFLDADCAPTPRWLEAGLAALEGADLLQGAVCPPPGAAIGPFDRTLWVTRPHGLYETANLFVRRELFDRLDGFESWLRPRRGIELGEDVWFGWRARRAGARIVFSSEALVHHTVFPRGPRAYAAERARLRFFPAMTARIPELREAFLYRRLFLSSRTAAFDLALAGAAVAVARRRPTALLAAAPYARLAYRDAHRGGRRRAPAVLAADLVADAIGAGALLTGSAQARTPVL